MLAWLVSAFNGKGPRHNPRQCAKRRCREQRCKDYRGGFDDGYGAGYASASTARAG